MYVAESEASLFPQQVGAVVTAVVPDGLVALAAHVAHGGDSGGGSERKTLSEPSARLSERLHTHLSGTPQRVDERHLHLESLPHVVPCEGVFLPCLRIAEGEARSVGERVEEVVHPFAVHPGMLIDRLERYYALPFVAQSVVILVYRVAAKHSEDGHRYLSRPGLGRHVGVETAGIVSLVPVSAPQGVAVRAYLVLAVARRFDAVSVVHICKCVRVDVP